MAQDGTHQLRSARTFRYLFPMAAYQNLPYGSVSELPSPGMAAMAQKGQWARKDSFCIRNLYGIYTENFGCCRSANALCDASKDKPMISNEKLMILNEKPRNICDVQGKKIKTMILNEKPIQTNDSRLKTNIRQ